MRNLLSMIIALLIVALIVGVAAFSKDFSPLEIREEFALNSNLSFHYKLPCGLVQKALAGGKGEVIYGKVFSGICDSDFLNSKEFKEYRENNPEDIFFWERFDPPFYRITAIFKKGRDPDRRVFSPA